MKTTSFSYFGGSNISFINQNEHPLILLRLYLPNLMHSNNVQVC